MTLLFNPQVEVGVFHLREGYLTQVCSRYSFIESVYKFHNVVLWCSFPFVRLITSQLSDHPL